MNLIRYQLGKTFPNTYRFMNKDVNNNGNEIALKIVISNDMTIDCSVQNMGCQNSVPRDDFSNPNLRKSLWPVVF